MSKKILIDAAHVNETRMAIINEKGHLENLDIEIPDNKTMRGNIYLAKVTRIEPSLQAAFIDYGGNKHGFLAFSDIHSDYFQIPIADREAMKNIEIIAEEINQEIDEVKYEISSLSSSIAKRKNNNTNISPTSVESSPPIALDIKDEKPKQTLDTSNQQIEEEMSLDIIANISDISPAEIDDEINPDNNNEEEMSDVREQLTRAKDYNQISSSIEDIKENEDKILPEELNNAQKVFTPFYGLNELYKNFFTIKNNSKDEFNKIISHDLKISYDLSLGELFHTKSFTSYFSLLNFHLPISKNKRKTVSYYLPNKNIIKGITSFTKTNKDKDQKKQYALVINGIKDISLFNDNLKNKDILFFTNKVNRAYPYHLTISKTYDKGKPLLIKITKHRFSDHKLNNYFTRWDKNITIDPRGITDPKLLKLKALNKTLMQSKLKLQKTIGDRIKLTRQYKIQEVIKKNQILLIQLVKDERGAKGAALTTFLSLAGRYCVLMPNNNRGGGVSRKISNESDRRNLKSIINSLTLPKGMGLIIRTAGSSRSKNEIKFDYQYLIKLWETIRSDTLQSNAPSLIYEEADLLKRTIRDYYSKDFSEIIIEGESAFYKARTMMKLMLNSHVKKVKQHKSHLPIFTHFHIEQYIDSIYEPKVILPSGGYLIIHPTEALVSIDINSGKATSERNIEETAYFTNLEAAVEIARQCRLRDLAGLIVIDFIDMIDYRHERAVEKLFKEHLKNDNAKLQISRISSLGLLEMSRQRRQMGIGESTTSICQHCIGTGLVRNIDTTSARILRAIEAEIGRQRNNHIKAFVSQNAALHILNNHRGWYDSICKNTKINIEIAVDYTKYGDQYYIHSRFVSNQDNTQNLNENKLPEKNNKNKSNSGYKNLKNTYDKKTNRFNKPNIKEHQQESSKETNEAHTNNYENSENNNICEPHKAKRSKKTNFQANKNNTAITTKPLPEKKDLKQTVKNSNNENNNNDTATKSLQEEPQENLDKPQKTNANKDKNTTKAKNKKINFSKAFNLIADQFDNNKSKKQANKINTTLPTEKEHNENYNKPLLKSKSVNKKTGWWDK